MTIQGVLGEPYCSEQCRNEGGKAIFQAGMQHWSGICGSCQKPVIAGMNPGDASIVPFNKQTFYFCLKCAKRVSEFVKRSSVCVICGKKI